MEKESTAAPSAAPSAARRPLRQLQLLGACADSLLLELRMAANGGEERCRPWIEEEGKTMEEEGEDLVCLGVFRSVVPATSDNDTAAFANARIDWKETPESHVFKADLPGVKKEEVKVEVEEGNVLVISGQRSKEKEDKNDKWHRVERSSGQFMRRFRLPENAKVDQVKAGLENGVLTVTVPKAEVKKPEVKAIEISG
uniref:SHSP domain-containing protein n=1 Tax=Oryza meridionalis TaxID=40149 RepID=A0A0E0BWT3_9ORYZ